ncbi:MAG TPA: zf-TFIIB domain-containing protein [Ignavibacteriaceae bacterium]
MNCPACKNPMIILELNHVEIDFCSACKGIWLDGGELELLFQNSESNSLYDSFTLKSDYIEEKRKCPICKIKMEKVEFDSTNIVLDRCTNNHGLWFDNGELSLLLKSEKNTDNKIVQQLKEIFGE